MHSALFIDEILLEVFELSDRPELVHAARTCKTWKEPALDRLWRRLGIISPLLDLIPGISCENGVYTVDDKILPKDLKVFHYYALRIKSIDFRMGYPLSAPLLALIKASCPTNSLTTVFPNLTYANILPSGHTNILSIGPSSKLRHLEVDLSFGRKIDDEHSIQYLEQTSQLALQLERFILRGNVPHCMNQSIAQMRSLRILSLRTGATASLTLETINAIGTFPLLEEFEIYAGKIDIKAPYDSPLYDTLNTTFPSLKTLRIHTDDSLAKLLLRKLQSGSLKNLQIDFTTEDVRPSLLWDPVFDLISTKASNSLEVLILEHHITDDISTDAGSSSQQTGKADDSINFGVLSSLTCLRTLAIYMDSCLDICDADIADMGRWWQMLEDIELGTTSDPEGPAKATVACLPVLARTLPRLKHLFLPLDITAPYTVDDVPSDTSQDILEILRVECKSIPDASTIVPYLHRVFPSLMYVGGYYIHRGWEEVESRLQTLRLS